MNSSYQCCHRSQGITTSKEQASPAGVTTVSDEVKNSSHTRTVWLLALCSRFQLIPQNMLIPPDRHSYPRVIIIMTSSARISAIDSKKSFVDSGHRGVLGICTAHWSLYCYLPMNMRSANILMNLTNDCNFFQTFTQSRALRFNIHVTRRHSRNAILSQVRTPQSMTYYAPGRIQFS